MSIATTLLPKQSYRMTREDIKRSEVGIEETLRYAEGYNSLQIATKPIIEECGSKDPLLEVGFGDEGVLIKFELIENYLNVCVYC